MELYNLPVDFWINQEIPRKLHALISGFLRYKISTLLRRTSLWRAKTIDNLFFFVGKKLMNRSRISKIFDTQRYKQVPRITLWENLETNWGENIAMERQVLMLSNAKQRTRLNERKQSADWTWLNIITKDMVLKEVIITNELFRVLISCWSTLVNLLAYLPFQVTQAYYRSTTSFLFFYIPQAVKVFVFLAASLANLLQIMIDFELCSISLHDINVDL